MLWNEISPADAEEARDIATYICDSKVMVRERIAVNNGSLNEHNVCAADEDGKHRSSNVAFAKVHATYEDFQSFEKRARTLHIVKSPIAMYLIDDDLSVINAAQKDHTLLEDLLDIACHDELLLLDGSLDMQGRMHFTGYTLGAQSQLYGAGDSDALDPAHVSLSWYAAHGDGCLRGRHMTDHSMFMYHTDRNDYWEVWRHEDVQTTFRFFPLMNGDNVQDLQVSRDGTGPYTYCNETTLRGWRILNASEMA